MDLKAKITEIIKSLPTRVDRHGNNYWINKCQDQINELVGLVEEKKFTFHSEVIEYAKSKGVYTEIGYWDKGLRIRFVSMKEPDVKQEHKIDLPQDIDQFFQYEFKDMLSSFASKANKRLKK